MTQAVYYRQIDGRQPVDEFLGAIGDPRFQALLDRQIDRLTRLGRPLLAASPSSDSG